MADWRNGLRTGMGMAPTRELIEAQRGFDRRTVRQVRRRVRRGEAETDPRLARLAVALARDHLRLDRAARGWVWWVFVAVVVLWAASGAHSLATGEYGLGLLFAGWAVFGVWMIVQRPRQREGARRAEQLNLAALEAGEPLPPAEQAVAAPRAPSTRAPWIVLTFCFYVVGFGLLTTLTDGDPVTVENVVGRGLAFGILMTVINQLWTRRRLERS